MSIIIDIIIYFKKYIILGIVIFVLIFGILHLVFQPWRAVFLANNQVYFGHFRWMPFTSTVKLKDIYYLQTNQQLQKQGASASDNQEFSIVKLGKEIHGPDDKMVIVKDQILFWEDLRKDSAVVKAIEIKRNK